MHEPIDVVAHNRVAWDRLVADQDQWTRPVTPAEVERARAGEWSIVLIGHEPVDRSWFPADLAGVDVLCLAGAGGQQGPILAAAGANVTVFDNSPAQLGQDELVAARDGLDLTTVLGDMRDLGAFGDGTFDLVVNPVSNVFCPDLHPVWRECRRVLRSGGELLVGFMNPDIFVFDFEAMEEREELVVRHALPFSDLADLSPEERSRLFGPGAALEHSHTMADQVGGQLAAGFVITDFAEAPHHDSPTSRFMPGYFATRAVRRG